MWYFWAKKLIEIWHLLITEKFFFWPFRKWKYDLFFSQKVDGKMIFTDYWKFLFWTFQRRKIRSFLSQEVDGKMIITGYREVLVLNFSMVGNAIFFQSKNWWKTWSFWAFHDISGLRKYRVFCAVKHNKWIVNKFSRQPTQIKPIFSQKALNSKFIQKYCWLSKKLTSFVPKYALYLQTS